MMRLFSLALVGVQLLTMTAALPNVTRTGKYLYDESGNRFYIKVGTRHLSVDGEFSVSDVVK